MTLGAKKQQRTTRHAHTDHDERRARVLRIAELQAGGDWQGRRMIRALADEWGVAYSTVERYSAEAWLLNEADRATLDQMRTEVNGALRFVMQAGKRDQRGADGKLLAKRDLGAVVNASRTFAKINGLEAAVRVEHTGAAGGPISVQVTEDHRARACNPDELARVVETGVWPADIEERALAQLAAKH